MMAQAAALAQIEDLPEDMRRLTDTMLAEHEVHLAHDREVQGLVEGIRYHWRRWPELGWAASAQEVPVEKLPAHAAWREEGAALLQAGRSLVKADGEAAHREVAHRDVARHLHAMPGGSAGLEEAVEMLERTRLLDDAGRFERAWHALRERAAESVVPEIYAPGYRQVAELGRELVGAEGLDAQAQRAVAEWREVDTAQTALAEEARTLPGSIAGVAGGGPAAGRARRARSRPSRAEVLARGRRQAGGHGRGHAAPGRRPRALPGRRAGAGARLSDRRPKKSPTRSGTTATGHSGWLTNEVNRQARETRTEAFHVPRYGELVAQAEALSAQAVLPARTQEAVASWLDYHARSEPVCREIREWPMRMEALTADCPEASCEARRARRLAAAGGAPARRGPRDAGERRPPTRPIWPPCRTSAMR